MAPCTSEMISNAMIDDGRCPKCNTDMEAIQADVEGLKVEHLQLCPDCYTVTWSDKQGLHVRQGVPVKKNDGRANDA